MTRVLGGRIWVVWTGSKGGVLGEKIKTFRIFSNVTKSHQMVGNGHKSDPPGVHFRVRNGFKRRFVGANWVLGGGGSYLGGLDKFQGRGLG